MILLETGQLLTCGYGSHGQLGHKNTLNYFEPKLVKDLVDREIKVVDISAGQHHSVVQTGNGDVYLCGLAEYGQLGLGDTVS